MTTETPIGTELYERAITDCRPEHRELMVEVWSPTPWMIDVVTKDREQALWHWCYRNFGPESSPIHHNQGNWMRGNVTISGKTWFGFSTEKLMRRFEAHLETL